ncbi:MAG: UvrD-helicase domain-containing protein, partial [Candidatus Gastranaerophilaceae bacterium]
MLINATLRTNKSEILQNEYINLVNSGINTDEILVLSLNSYKKQQFIKAVESGITIPHAGKHNIQTFYGLCYNAVNDNWADVENSINFGETAIIPNLCGLELSRMLLSDSISKDSFRDYFSKTNLLHQLFKRIQLSVLNNLSEEEIYRKSAILNETFYEDAQKTYDRFRRLSLKLRSFDYLRQLSILPYIVKNTDYFSKIKYLFIDDADEITYAELNFIKELQPHLKDWFIAYDRNGASRCGYLSAYKTSVYEFEKSEKPVLIEKKDIPSENAELLYKNILTEKKSLLKNFELYSYVKRLDMLDEAFSKVDMLLKNGVKLSDILIITPIADDMLKSFCKGHRIQIISGSEKPKDVKILRNAFTFLKMINSDLDIKLEKFELKCFFYDVLKIPQKYSNGLVSKCIEEKRFTEYDFNHAGYQSKYNNFTEFVQKCDKSSLSKELIDFFKYFSQFGVSKRDIKKFDFLLKEIRSFENAFGVLDRRINRNIILQFENGIISENPSVAEEIDNNAIIVSTPQKVIDFEIKRKYQIWLDISSDLWTMRDIGVLYNAWVFNAEWKDKEFTFEDNIRLSREKNARVLRKLLLCCEEKVFAYFSQYDSAGRENFGIMPSYFISQENSEIKKLSRKIIPREDQNPLLNT